MNKHTWAYQHDDVITNVVRSVCALHSFGLFLTPTHTTIGFLSSPEIEVCKLPLHPEEFPILTGL